MLQLFVPELSQKKSFFHLSKLSIILSESCIEDLRLIEL